MEIADNRIKQERLGRGWSIRELARRAGVSPTTISELENNPIRATTKLLRIAKALRVNQTWLETGKGTKEPVTDPVNAYVIAESIEDLAEKLVARGDEEVVKLWRAILAVKSEK